MAHLGELVIIREEELIKEEELEVNHENTYSDEVEGFNKQRPGVEENELEDPQTMLHLEYNNQQEDDAKLLSQEIWNDMQEAEGVMAPPHKWSQETRPQGARGAHPGQSLTTHFTQKRLARQFFTPSKRKATKMSGNDSSSSEETDASRVLLSKRQRGLLLTAEQECGIVEWLQENEILYNKKLMSFKDVGRKARLFEEKAATLNVHVNQLKTWIDSMRTRFGRLCLIPPGELVLDELTERDRWIYTSFQFLRPHIVRCRNRRPKVDMAKKRSESVLPLIGSPIEEILGSKLPSNGDILRHFMYHHKTLKKADLSSAQAVIFRVQEFWNRARIPTITAKSATRKVLALKEEWRVIQKSAKRKGPTQEKKEQEFSEKLNNLFDIASADALEKRPLIREKPSLRTPTSSSREKQVVKDDASQEINIDKPPPDPSPPTSIPLSSVASSSRKSAFPGDVSQDFLGKVFEHCQQTLALQNRLLSASQNQLTHVKQVTHFMAFLGSLCETMTPAAWKSFMVKAHKLALEHTSMPECQPTPQKVTHRPAAQQCHQPSLHNPPTQKAQQFQQQIEQLQQQLAAIQAQAPPLTALSTPSQVPNLSDLSFASTIFEQHDLSALATPSPHPSSASSEPPTVNEL